MHFVQIKLGPLLTESKKLTELELTLSTRLMDLDGSFTENSVFPKIGCCPISENRAVANTHDGTSKLSAIAIAN